MFEIETQPALLAHLDAHGGLVEVALQGLDLRGLGPRLAGGPFRDCVLLGCKLDQEVEHLAVLRGNLLFPRIPGLPFHPYRPRLYSPDELYLGYRPGSPESLAETLDGRIYGWFSQQRVLGRRESVLCALAQRLHDHAVDNALEGFLHDGAHQVVGVMGGHALQRDEAAFRDAARLGRRLTRDGYLVATGGGPGAMEAAHLGAWLAPCDDGALDEALALLAEAPSYRDPGWVETAQAVRERWPEGRRVQSLGIPTWFYGHEPSTLFASHVAKYFSNSLREDGLLAIAAHGVVYAPGSAGTVQEIFMDAAQNHYVTFHVVSPMVLLGRQYWTEQLPALGLLEALARDRPWARYLCATDDPEEAAAFIRSRPPRAA